MSLKPQNPFWHSIEAIQTCLKATRGLGIHFPIDFKVKLNLKEEVQINKRHSFQTDLPSIQYCYKRVGAETEEMLKKLNPLLSEADLNTLVERHLLLNSPEDYCLR